MHSHQNILQETLHQSAPHAFLRSTINSTCGRRGPQPVEFANYDVQTKTVEMPSCLAICLPV